MGRIKQSVAWWCFMRKDIGAEQLARAIADTGYEAVEQVSRHYWPMLREHGLSIACLAGHQSLIDGLNKRENHERIEKEILANIALAEQWHIPILIVFSGNRYGVDDATGAKITAEGLQRVVKAAEASGVTLALELLNSKVDHKGYQCDKTAWGIEVCKLVNSPNVKLLYDIYHMQIMEGDIMRTIRDYHTYFAHYHTAGNPGRHELNNRQELQYSAIFHTIADVGYEGYVGHEFIPTGDPLVALKQAFDLCDSAS